MDAIRTTNLVKKYGEKLAVENLSLTVRAGTMFGFLGPNGSGKSTTIGCMTGLLDATSGEIELLGQRFNPDNAAIKRRIGVMPEPSACSNPLRAEFWPSWRACTAGWATTRGARTTRRWNSPKLRRPFPNTPPECKRWPSPPPSSIRRRFCSSTSLEASTPRAFP
jgi:ABC-type dipeptide/oligopeptide/nickel transport system ATPase component